MRAGAAVGPAHSRLYRVTICRQFSSCRLYSWILFTCTSNMEEGLIFTLYFFSRKAENFNLFSWGEKRIRMVKPRAPKVRLRLWLSSHAAGQGLPEAF